MSITYMADELRRFLGQPNVLVSGSGLVLGGTGDGHTDRSGGDRSQPGHRIGDLMTRGMRQTYMEE